LIPAGAIRVSACRAALGANPRAASTTRDVLRRIRPMMHLDSNAASAQRATEFLKTVAHVGRLRIICALMRRELSAGDLACEARIAAPALSQQATILEANGLIGRRRAGRSVYYRLAAPEAKALARLLHRLFCRETAQPRRRIPTKTRRP
jgi:ArsR family transcriptional regulator